MFHFPLPKDRILPENIECRSPHFDKVNHTILDRIKGCFVGLVVSDILEAGKESSDSARRMKASEKSFNIQAGQWTGNTSMALCLASSLITQRNFNAYDQMVRYKWWYKYGYLSATGYCLDVDHAMRDALEVFCRRQSDLNTFYGYLTEDKLDNLSTEELHRSLEFNVYCSRQGVNGNAALARLAPIPLLYYRTPAVAVELSGLSARLTHGDDKVVDACRYFGALVAAAIRGEPKEALLNHRFYDDHRDWFDWKDLHPNVRTVAMGSFKQLTTDNNFSRSTHDIVQTLEAVLWAFWNDGNSFQKGAVDIINLNRQLKNAVPIYGQLAGAYYGFGRIPAQWMEFMYAKRLIFCTAEWLFFLSDRMSVGPVKQNEVPKYMYSPSRWESSNLVDAARKNPIHANTSINPTNNTFDSTGNNTAMQFNNSVHNDQRPNSNKYGATNASPWNWFRR